MRNFTPRHLLALLFTLLVLSVSLFAQPDVVGLQHIGTYHTGVFDDGAAEISAYDQYGQRLYFVNASTQSIDVLDVSNPASPDSINTIDITPYGGNANSVICFDGIVAAAVEANVKQDPGFVVFFDTLGNYLGQVTAGALPDMISITSDHQKILVANEGEPNDDYDVDPDGSITIIDISGGIGAATVSHLDFSNFEAYRQSFEDSTIDNWVPVVSPATYNTDGDSVVGGNEDIWDAIWEFTSDIETKCHGNFIWGMQDLDNGNGGGDFWHTLDFPAVDISTKTRATLSFRYFSIEYDGSDTLAYIVEYNNGTGWNRDNMVVLDGNSQKWEHVSINVPIDSGYVRLRLMAYQNGSDDYAAFDDVELSFLDESTRVFGNDRWQTVQQDLEPEYIAISKDNMQAFVGIQEANAFAIIDLTTNTLVDIVGLGFKDHSLAGNALDASNDDGMINIQNWPVKGIPMPDAITSFEAGGMNYYITANEGDSRDYDGYSEEERVKDLVLDPTIFTDPNLQDDEMLGRLNITLSKGDIDCDGDYDELYSWGARSFSIYDANGMLVYDSGDDFEQISAMMDSAYFNSQGDLGSFDNRSDDKGPEPEAVITGVIAGRTYAFIGNERNSSIMTYDVSNPIAPVFMDYTHNTNDIAPEGILFLDKDIAPMNQHTLIVSNEVSGTVSFYRVRCEVYDSVDTRICDGDSLLVGGAYQTMSGIYNDTIMTEAGCDSIIITDLTVVPSYAIAMTAEICGGDSILLGGVYQTSSGTYIDALMTAEGCDSTITTVLTVNPSYNMTMDETICAGENFVFGGSSYSTAGTYVAMLNTTEGCDSVVQLNLSVNTVNASVTISLATVTLTANEGSADSYQWIDCSDNSAISGETDQSFNPSAEGTYAVVVEKNGCSDTSDCYTITDINVGLAEISAGEVNIYPNPNTGKFTIELSNKLIGATASLYTTNGELLHESVVNQSQQQMDMSQLPEGIYFVRIANESYSGTFKLVKE